MKHSNACIPLITAALVLIATSTMATPEVPNNVPDAGSTSVLLASALIAVATVKRWIAR